MDRDIVQDSEKRSESGDEHLTSHVKPRESAAPREAAVPKAHLQDMDWAARPAPRRAPSFKESFDFGALKILLILVALTVGMTLALKFLI